MELETNPEYALSPRTHCKNAEYSSRRKDSQLTTMKPTISPIPIQILSSSSGVVDIKLIIPIIRKGMEICSHTTIKLMKKANRKSFICVFARVLIIAYLPLPLYFSQLSLNLFPCYIEQFFFHIFPKFSILKSFFLPY
ncbi:unnamed protein product [Moneuplotes crassus]|uniref:Uncharacterized protein n=1 Tax=Euplotes crassus TaxID=5936 RepID=A0AAD1U7F4_EUPCR|nr:unnamed protein product [Moneuplotes crassus]